MSAVGIDLGTTNTVVGCVRSGKVHVLADEKGSRLLPSVVSFHPNGDVLVGLAAKARRIIDAPNTVYSHKRLTGRSWGSPEIARARERYPFDLREGPGQGLLVHARGHEYTLPEISAFVLKRARHIAERATGETVERAVITVPAHFNELQRASTKVAGRVSGLEVLRILNEPTAAALAYGLGRTGNERVAVYDFGGGTFDCTLLDLSGNVFEVLATAGDSFLGGDDVDNLIADRMADSFLKMHRQDAREDPELFERLKTTAEEIKVALSTAESHTVRLADFGHSAGGSTRDFEMTLTRGDLDALMTPLVDRSLKVTEDALSLARLSPDSFDKVILVGGSTRIPLVRRRVEAFFGSPPLDRINPDEVVAIGAAIQAAALTEGIRRRSVHPTEPQGARPSQARPGQPDRRASHADAPGIKPPGAVPTRPMPGRALPTAKSSPSAQLHAHDPATLTQATQQQNSRPDPSPSFGAIDEPPSIVSTPGTSSPSFPSMSLVTGHRATASGADFGHVSDLSLIANATQPDAITQARSHPLAGDNDDDPESEGPTEAFTRATDTDDPESEDPTEAFTRATDTDDGKAVPRGSGDGLEHEAARPHQGREAAPRSPLLDRENLPSVSPRPRPPRTPGQVSTSLSPAAPMLGKPPPVASPQPFGPMEKLAPPESAAPRTAAMSAAAPTLTRKPAAAPPAPPAPYAPPSPPTPYASAPPAPYAPPSPATPYASAPPAAPAPYAPPAPAAPYASAPPAPYARPSPYAAPAPYAPPPYASAPPAPLTPYASAPPAPYASAPPPAGGSFAPVGVGQPAPLLVDVIPRALVVETAGGYTDTIIPRNSKIPCERTRRFATGRDMQTSVRVRVAQGESPAFSQNTYLGEVLLTALRPAPRGEVTVAVTFEVDADGTLRVRALDLQTGQEARAMLQLVGVADESSVVMMINRFAQHPVVSGSS